MSAAAAQCLDNRDAIRIRAHRIAQSAAAAPWNTPEVLMMLSRAAALEASSYDGWSRSDLDAIALWTDLTMAYAAQAWLQEMQGR